MPASARGTNYHARCLQIFRFYIHLARKVSTNVSECELLTEIGMMIQALLCGASPCSPPQGQSPSNTGNSLWVYLEKPVCFLLNCFDNLHTLEGLLSKHCCVILCMMVLAFNRLPSLNTATISVCRLVIKCLKLHNNPKRRVLKPSNLLWAQANILNAGMSCNYSQGTE